MAANVIIRDKVKDGISIQGIKHTKDIIDFASEGKLPDKILMTFIHRRWTDNWLLWTWELIWQNLKNQ